MALTIAELEAYADAAARTIGLAIAAEDRASVIENLAMVFAQGELVLEFPLPENIEAAPVFEA